MRAILRGPGDQHWTLDTPHGELLGEWLRTIFDSFGTMPTAYVPLQFTLEIR